MSLESFNVGKGLKSSYAAAKVMAEGAQVPEFDHWLALVAGVDRGKTHLAVAVVRAWLKESRAARYVYVPLLLDNLRAGFDSEVTIADQNINFYLKIPLLVLDDLGAEYSTPWVRERLEVIIDYRYEQRLPTVITTNCSLDELPERISSRLIRYRGDQVVFLMDAPEYSLTKGGRDGTKGTKEEG